MLWTLLSTTDPPVLFDQPKLEAKGKHLVQTFKCHWTPVDVGSPTYKVAVLYFSIGTPETWIQFQKYLDRVFTGQGDMIGPNKYAKIRQLLQEEDLFTTWLGLKHFTMLDECFTFIEDVGMLY